MSESQRVLLLIAIMVGVASGVSVITIASLYEAAFAEQRERLSETVQSQARLIEAVARFDSEHSSDYVPGGSYAATLSQIRDAREQFEGFGATGEFILARREGDEIEFLFRHGRGGITIPESIPFFSDLAEPMRRALLGESGWIVAVDYQGKTVLAAHEPVSVLGLGIVAKIDLAEIRAPFIDAALLAGGAALVLILGGVALFLRLINPVIRRLERHSAESKREIASRERTEAELRKSERRWRDLAEAMPYLVWTCTSEGHCDYLSRQWVEYTGKAEAEQLGYGWLEQVHPEERADLMVLWRQSLATGVLLEIEVRIRRADGAWRLFMTRATPIRDAEDRIVKWYGSNVDIDDLKRAEAERLSLERQVQHAQKLESLGVLAGGIAHDFNNLLMVILGNADLALDELSPMSPARGNLEEIEKASKRAAVLAKQMLAYSGRGRFVVESIDTGELLVEMTHLLEVSISKKAVLEFNIAENLPAIHGDATQIRQVIMNLITNASEAIGDKSGVIALSTGAMNCDRAYLDEIDEVLRASLDEPLPEGVYVFFEVADTGCGMKGEVIEKIFDPFFTTKFTGRGLGMSAVLGIVRGHQGALKIYSEVGKGTTFKVLFPASEPMLDGIPKPGEETAEGKDWRGSGAILLADDEETVCAVGKRMLERLGFSVLTAPDGREALAMFREHADEIVCVLLDLTMPHMDGEVAFREMRRIDPEITVVLCSGYNEQDATDHFTGKGLAGFLQKPFSQNALKEKLMAIL